MAGSSGSAALPVIDVGPLVGGAAAAAMAAVAEQIQVIAGAEAQPGRYASD